MITTTTSTFVVLGNGRFGTDATLAQAKRNFTRYGGKLSDGYAIVELPQGISFDGIDGFGRVHYSGDTENVEPVITEIAPRSKRK
jgi:hypothetical protein